MGDCITRTTTRKRTDHGGLYDKDHDMIRTDQVGLYDKGHDKEKDRSWRTV